MDIQKLKMLIKQEEGMKLDFKENLTLKTESDKKEFAKDIIAIANSTGGRGYLVIGVRDKSKEIVGIKEEEFNEERIQQIISNRCEPPINIRVESIQYKDKFVGVITVFKSTQRPHQMRQTGAFYLRRGSTTDFARRDEIASMLQEAGIISNELIPMHKLDIEVLNRKHVHHYLGKTNLFPEESVEKEIWNNLGIIHIDEETGKAYPTVGGILLFSDQPQNYLPHTALKIILYKSKEEKEVKIIKGNIIEMLNKSYEHINEYIKDSSYPKEAIYQGIANAMIHRDYFDITRNIVVCIGERSIEISNPGTLPKGQNMHTIIRDSNPSKRNPWLYSKLLILDENKRFLRTGFGLREIYLMFKDTGGLKFLNIEKRNLFKIIMPGLGSYRIKKETK